MSSKKRKTISSGSNGSSNKTLSSAIKQIEDVFGVSSSVSNSHKKSKSSSNNNPTNKYSTLSSFTPYVPSNPSTSSTSTLTPLRKTPYEIKRKPEAAPVTPSTWVNNINIASTSASTPSSAIPASKESILQDLLSPRKKRRGWVPNGLAEYSAQLIKRHSTSHTLWLHENSRNGFVEPDLLLRVLEIYSEKPHSLMVSQAGTSSSTSSGPSGFMTAGWVEKMLITRCAILSTDEDDNARQNSDEEDINQLEGIVIFSLQKASTTSTNPANTNRVKREPAANTSIAPNSIRAYSTSSEKKPQYSLPSSIAELHTTIEVNSVIACWDPWSVVELDRESKEETSVPKNKTEEAEKLEEEVSDGENVQEQVYQEQETIQPEYTGRKALLVSRFAVTTIAEGGSR